MPSLRIIHVEAASTFGGQEGHIFKEMLAMRDRGHYLDPLKRLALATAILCYRWLAERRI